MASPSQLQLHLQLATSLATGTKKFEVSTNFEAFLSQFQLHLQLGNKGQLRSHLELEEK
jgi:hypothetical protein